jgi:LysM repeat protein/uncharacterized protein YvpB
MTNYNRLCLKRLSAKIETVFRTVILRKSFLLLIFMLVFTILPPPRAWADPVPDSAMISGFSGFPQTYNLSCESRSAVDLAAFWGLQVSESDFLSNLPRSDNPDEGFVGHANDPWGFTPPYSYGVHADPVAKLLRQYGLKAEAQHGLRWKDLQAEIASGHPVIVWVIGQMWNGFTRTYVAQSGKSVTVAPYEHSMILIGYDTGRAHVVDAYSGQTLVYPLDAFLNSWVVLGNMAVFSRGLKEPPATPTAVSVETEVPETTPEIPDSYTVQPGDYLVALADRFDTTWQELVEINDLDYPYNLYPGQLLRVTVKDKSASQKDENTETKKKTSQEPELEIQDGTYIVKAGDYLTQIARELDLDWGVLAQANNLTPPYKLYPGQVLLLPGVNKTPEPAHKDASDDLPTTYVVRQGDYLAEIARRFDIDWRILADLNAIGYPYVIHAGQTLKLK